MTALRHRLLPAAILAFAGICHGQYAPLQDPEPAIEMTLDAHGDQPLQVQWGDRSPSIELYEVEPPAGLPLVSDEVDAVPMQTWVEEEMPGQPMPVAECETCNAEPGQHCHGVCRDPGHPAKPKKKPGDVDRGDCPPLRYRMADCERAGNPHCVAKWAKCSITDRYSSWYVGGGTPFWFGRCRQPHEGTWGLDYDGPFKHNIVWLNYTRHGRMQGGEGAYQTDGEPEFISRTHELLGLGH